MQHYVIIQSCEFIALPADKSLVYFLVSGVIYKDKCPVQPKIPIYHIVFGCFLILEIFMCIFAAIRKSRGDQEGNTTKFISCGSIVSCFMMAWFICGNVWVYANYKPEYHDPASKNYCHKTLYLFTFWIITSGYILSGVCCCLGICTMIYGTITGK